MSAAVAVAGQLKLTSWARARWSSPQALVRGLATMGAAFLPLTLVPTSGGAWRTTAQLGALAAAVALLAAASAVIYPLEMDTVVALAGGRWVATHYGLYNTVAGLGITLGNLATGALWDLATAHRAHGWSGRRSPPPASAVPAPSTPWPAPDASPRPHHRPPELRPPATSNRLRTRPAAAAPAPLGARSRRGRRDGRTAGAAGRRRSGPGRGRRHRAPAPVSG
ncbi:hypothetical protein [Streptomyces huiliensis]|uniref:hypothetical protein n=1 Tax=Streptomyces huiliensis TaxID=2876027 RepID=UPI00355620B1